MPNEHDKNFEEPSARLLKYDKFTSSHLYICRHYCQMNIASLYEIQIYEYFQYFDFTLTHYTFQLTGNQVPLYVTTHREIKLMFSLFAFLSQLSYDK